MSRPAKRGPGRPRGRAVVVPVLLPLAPELHALSCAAAERAGLPLTEWLRRAALAMLARPMEGM